MNIIIVFLITSLIIIIASIPVIAYFAIRSYKSGREIYNYIVSLNDSSLSHITDVSYKFCNIRMKRFVDSDKLDEVDEIRSLKNNYKKSFNVAAIVVICDTALFFFALWFIFQVADK